ncbi:Dynamin-binding protein [Geodia barretti]|uniref:Dynamin-binding protein n=1 Tax=Geodia barretti TaxID=519541 RepID=A0AA35WFQ4_GEOBA|nr:Dynamin-binding protein [Geodia barretti]
MAGGGGGDRLMPCARAKFEFQAKSDVELSFSAGVSVRLLRRIDDNWLEGELEGRVGIFPASYVEIELGTPSKARESSLASSGRPYAIGLFEFSGDCQGDLSFAKGELIELLGSAGSGWMKGKTGRGEGIFPASFVEIVKLPVTPPASKTSSSPPGDEPRRSPEYAEPGQAPVRGSEGSRELAREQDLTEEVVREDGEAVFENGFSDDDREEEEEEEEEGTPVPPPRSKHKSRSLSSSVLLSGEGEGRTTPSRSPPISPRLPGTSPPPRRRQLSRSYTSGLSPRPRPRPRRHNSLTDFQRQINTLQAGLTIEKKLLVSARTLLEVTQDEVKREKLRGAISTHESNVQALRQQLAEMKGQRETVSESSPPPVRPSSPPHQHLPPPKPLSLSQQRAKVIEELVTTETDYHAQMHITCEKLIPAMEEIRDVNAELLFGNLGEVTCVSHDLLAALRETCAGEEKVGEVFVRFGPRLRSTYAAYCRNHDTASSLVEKYSENPELTKIIKTSLDAIRAVTQAWDLQSLLIKPVQRVLKYPLLLGKLVQTTGDGHPDYKPVHRARQVVGQVAQDINEIKRRKDLVERYTGPGKEERRGTVSVHSLQKKVRRFQQTLTQLTGLRSKTVDPEFEELEQKMMSLETFLRQLIRNITTWQEDLQKAVDSQEVLGEGMLLYVPSDLRPLTCYQRSLGELQGAVKTHVSTSSGLPVKPCF